MEILEELFMTGFNPSPDFTARTMMEVRRYEAALPLKENHAEIFLHSKLGFMLLSAGGALFGLINLIRLASMLLFPALCH
jgi:hypothetical protein